MLLQSLREYSQRLEAEGKLPPTLYAERPVRYIIELDREGKLLNPEPTDTADPSNRRTRRGQPRLVPQMQRSSAIRPLLLADNAEYTLGISRPDSKGQRVADAHKAYLDLLDRCAQKTQDPRVRAVQAFLHGDAAASLNLPKGFDAGATITFRVADSFPVDQPGVQKFWAEENEPGDVVMQCLVCGRRRPVLKRLQGKIKPLPGSQPSGTALISANAEAFESYGLKASLIAPVCAECAEHFTNAANQLLADPSHHLFLGGTAFIFWTRQPVEFSFRDFMEDPQPEQVRALLDAGRSGRLQPDVDETAFYAAALSGSGGRAVVRDWIDTTVGEAKRNLALWFQRQRIVGSWGQEPTPLPLWRLSGATARDVRKDLAPQTPRMLLRAAVTGAPLPPNLLHLAIRRDRAEQDVTMPRAALIKLVLCSQRQEGEETMIQLDPNNPSPAYRCGRLLAVLEQAQRLAVPSAEATVVSRFYGTASSAPASVFGRLLRGAQAHLDKLERDHPAAYAAVQHHIEEILDALDSFPRTLTLEEQGLFALGYYHQRAFHRAQALEASARKKEQTLDENED